MEPYKINVSNIRAHKFNNYIELYQHNFLDTHVYYNKCACNEYSALINRHLLEPVDGFNPKLAETILEKQRTLFLKDLNNSNVVKATHEFVMKNTRKCIYSRYNTAYRKIINNRLTPNEYPTLSEAFVKYEKWSYDKITNGNKAPRVIQHRSYEYLHQLKSFILPISKLFKNSSNLTHNQPINTIFMKYYKNHEQIAILKNNWDKFKRPCCLCLDMEAFDGHVTTTILESEHKTWESFYKDAPTMLKCLKLLLSKQLKNSGITKNGIKYLKEGSRLSGEWSTSDGNSVDNYYMLRAFIEHIIAYIHVNGDDSLILMDQDDLDKLKDLGFFKIFGMICKQDRIALTFEDINFCQCNPVEINGSYRFIKTPIRSMSRSTVCPSQYIKCIDRYLAGVGLCELASNVGVPILQTWALRMLVDSGFTKPLGKVDKNFALYTDLPTIEIQPISNKTRLSFFDAFNISPNEQIFLENSILTGLPTIYPKLQNFINKYSKFHLH